MTEMDILNKLIHWCDDCPKAYDNTCSGADAAHCENKKSNMIRLFKDEQRKKEEKE